MHIESIKIYSIICYAASRWAFHAQSKYGKQLWLGPTVESKGNSVQQIFFCKDFQLKEHVSADRSIKGANPEQEQSHNSLLILELSKLAGYFR